MSGKPSLRALARAAGVSPTTIGAWLIGRQFPRSIDGLLNVTRLLKAEAERRKLLAEGVATLLDEGRWRAAYALAAKERADATGACVQRSQAWSILADQEQQARLAALEDKPRPVSDWTAAQLNVHAAIPGGRSCQDFVLPDYVSRTHDEHLHERLKDVAAGVEAALVVVDGPSCVGKTRTAFEAVHANVPSWQLLFPKDTDSLLTILAAGAAGPGTVLWLNEAQEFLQGPQGEQAAVGLRRRLEQPGPALVIATLWPEYHRELTATPQAGQLDPHRNARKLLESASRYTVAPTFNDDELKELSQRARTDPSLAEAQCASGDSGMITQTLAAGPDLLHRYEHPGPDEAYGRAFITVAMDACRLGVRSPLPIALLEDAAHGYLTQAQRAEAVSGRWAEQALDYAKTKVKNVASALSNVARSTGSRIGPQPGVVRLSNYLDHHARTARCFIVPPDSFWETAKACITDPHDLTVLARAAHDRGLLLHAADLLKKAEKAGNDEAKWRLAWLRKRDGGEEGAEEFAHQVAADGNPFALWELAWLRELGGDKQGSALLFRQAARDGHTGALRDLVWVREQDGDRGSAEHFAREAVKARDTCPMRELAWVRELASDRCSAEALAREALEAGDACALLGLAWLRGRGRGRDEDRKGVEAVLRQVMPTRKTRAFLGMAWLEMREGNTTKARRLLRQAASARYISDTLSDLRKSAWMQELAGNRGSAEHFAREAVKAGDTCPMHELAWLRELAGDRGSAEHFAREAVKAGDTCPIRELAWLRELAGAQGSAETLAREVAAAGDTSALLGLARIRELIGDEGGAKRLLHLALAAGSTTALLALARVLERTGDRKGAEALIRRGLNVDDFIAE